MAGLDPKFRINLERVIALVVDGDPIGADILRQVLAGFGVRKMLRANTTVEAQDLVQGHEINLVLCSDKLPDGTGYDFVRWLRRSKIEGNAFTPVIMVSGHTRRSMVNLARDSGANFIVTKPISTKILLERVIWTAKENRPYVEAGDYLGPERRFHDLGPPASGGRRRNDADVSESAPAAPTVAGASAPSNLTECLAGAFA